MIYTLTLNPALDREYTVEAFEFDSVLRSPPSRIDCGGKGFNVSRAIAALGGTSVAMGFVGGWAGRMLAGALDNLGTAADFVWVSGETRTNVSIVSADYARYIKVNEPGPVITSAEQDILLDRIRGLVRKGDWWVLAGSLPPGVPDTFYAGIIDLVQGAGGHAILDTSGEALRAGCRAGAFLVKPNQAEAGYLTGLSLSGVGDAPEALTAVRALGPVHVVLSMGRSGAVLQDGERFWQVIPPAIAERNPIGAGDALVAGLVHALDGGSAMLEAVRRGVACGAAAASLDGTGVGSAGQVARLLEQVKVVAL